jgi:hypothetical protein
MAGFDFHAGKIESCRLGRRHGRFEGRGGCKELDIETYSDFFFELSYVGWVYIIELLFYRVLLIAQ